MAGAFVQKTGDYSDSGATSTTHVIAITNAPSVGNYIAVMLAGSGNIATISATDTQGNTYTVPTNGKRNSGTSVTGCILIAKVANALTTSDTITVTYSTAQACGAVVNEYSGIDATTPVTDSSAGDNGGVGTTAFDSGNTASTASTGDIQLGLLAMSATSAGITTTDGYTFRSSKSGVAFVRTAYTYDLAATNGNTAQFDGTYTTARQSAAIVVLLKAATGGGGPGGVQAGWTFGVPAGGL